MVAISVDSTSDSEALSEKLSLNFPLVSDTDRALSKAFGVHDPGNDIAWPAVYIVGADGAIVWRSFEDSYKERVPIEEILGGLPNTAAH